MKKHLISIASLALVSGFSSYAWSDEGMWMPKQLPQIEKQLKAAGLKLNPKTLTQLTDFPMGAVVSLGGCSASFVSPQGLVVTNHHCVYNSVAINSTKERNLLEDGFVAQTLSEELPAGPGSRIFVTKEVTEVSGKVISPDVAKLTGKPRMEAIERNIKSLSNDCEKDEGHRCTVSSFYGGLAYYLIKQLEIKDVRLVHAPPEGVGKFGGDTDNWMWPRHTGDYGFYRAYVSKEGKSAEFSKDNVPYVPKHYLKLAKEGVKEGDFIMVLGYPGRTNRHRLPSEISYAFDYDYPSFVKNSGETLAIIAEQTKGNKDEELKYAGTVAGINNYYKNRQGMIDSYLNSDILQRKTQEHQNLKAWVNANPKTKAEFAADIEKIEQLIEKRNEQSKRESYLSGSYPRLLGFARNAYRLAQEKTKPNAERRAGFQDRDLSRFKASAQSFDKTYVEKVDKALVMNSLAKYAASPAQDRNANFDQVLGIKDGMSKAELQTLIDHIYAGSQLGDTQVRMAWLDKSVADFKASKDSFIQAAVAMYEEGLKQEEAALEAAGNAQQSYANYMKAKIAYMQSKGLAVYPDANSTLRITFGKIASRPVGADGTTWTAFTTVKGVVAKHTGAGEFNAPANQLATIKAKDFGNYVDSHLKTVPVNFLATLDITGGNSGSAALNAKGELIGLAFDGTLDSIISDWDFNKMMTRSIQVDLRYMLWQMKHVDKAGNLVKEMGAE